MAIPNYKHLYLCRQTFNHISPDGGIISRLLLDAELGHIFMHMLHMK